MPYCSVRTWVIDRRYACRSPLAGVDWGAEVGDHGWVQREIDFNRDRRFRCGRCNHVWTVDLAWLERWRAAKEACLSCGITCEAENSGGVTTFDDDPALDDDQAKHLAWYHTTVRPNWPAPIDFAATLEDRTREMMGGDDVVVRWADRQSMKALHLGTYEAAIHNMLRRIVDHHDRDEQFFLYRVYLRPEVVLAPGWTIDPSNFVGDVYLDESFPPGAEAGRYVNYHEDPGGLSLAIQPSAVATTQRIAIPLTQSPEEPWIVDSVCRLSHCAPDRLLPNTYEHLAGVFEPSERQATAMRARTALVERLPINLQYQFEAATSWVAGGDPAEWAVYTFGLARLVWDPAAVLAELDSQVRHQH